MKLLLNSSEEDSKDDKKHYCMIYNKAFGLRNDIFILLEHPELILVCDQCERKLNNCPSVLLQLVTERKDLCFTCLLKIKDLPGNSTYYVRPNLHHTFTEDKWDISSDLLLLNALQRFGFGNWSYVKNYLDLHGKNFTEKEIEVHYRTFYLTDPNTPVFTDYPIEIQRTNTFTPSKQKQLNQQNQSEECQLSTIPGYNPKRDEHIFDYDPEAEDLISDLQFSDDDSPEQTQLKFQLLEAYNRRLQERKKREKFVMEHKLLCEEHQRNQLASSQTKVDYKKKLTPFARFMTFQESQNVLNHLSLQSTLKSEIRQLLAHRSNLSDPTFQNAFKAMSNIQQNQQEIHYKNAPQLKFKEIKLQRPWSKKSQIEDELKEHLYKIKIGGTNLQITNISQT